MAHGILFPDQRGWTWAPCIRSMKGSVTGMAEKSSYDFFIKKNKFKTINYYIKDHHIKKYDNFLTIEKEVFIFVWISIWYSINILNFKSNYLWLNILWRFSWKIVSGQQFKNIIYLIVNMMMAESLWNYTEIFYYVKVEAMDYMFKRN